MLLHRRTPRSTLFPYTTLFRSRPQVPPAHAGNEENGTERGGVDERGADVRLQEHEQDRHRARLHLRARDRKSTRLNSSHLGISYAVFCLKKKKKKNDTRRHFSN